jgi:hypothetical protein
MTTVVIQSGACGYTTTVTVKKDKEGKLLLVLDSDCAMVRRMLDDIAILDRFAPLSGFLQNPVYKSAAKHLKHVACVVPSGILKALEVEAGLNVPKDACNTFIRET